ncbi:MAG TPA: divalent metal cation transporter [Thermodesulfobacteriota bacterium]|jgi:Mn2+/Fe2+ NRAMP family transporter|nr:divalent metal cation transporter [Thermodesulfobacteriota bacterium]
MADYKKWVSSSRRSLWRTIGLFFILMGPGIITSNVDNDAGGITTYSLAGAEYGLKLIWSLIPIMIALIVVQEMGARMGVVTGKGLSDLIREKFGAKITFYLIIGLFLTNMGNVLSEFAGVAAGMEVFGVNKFISVPASAFLVWWMVVKGTYKSVEKAFLVACIFYISYIITGIIVKPDWGYVFEQFLHPQLSLQPSETTMVIGLVGTTIAPWMQFYLQASIVEKGIKTEDYKFARFDVVLGAVMVHVVAFFIILVCAETLFKHGVRIETAKDAALSLAPLAGKYCTYLFAFGLVNASLFAASILPLSTTYLICEGLGWEAGIDKKLVEAPQFYGFYSLIIFLGAGIILYPNFPLIPIMYFSQVVNGMVLPFILIFMLLIINDKKIMMDHTNGPIFNAVAWVTSIVMIVLTFLLIIRMV